MANIDKELNKIKNAVKGKDVRGSIHDGIDKINKETESTTKKQEVLSDTFEQLVIDKGNSNAEVVASRGKENWLPDRLDKTDTKIDDNHTRLTTELAEAEQYEHFESMISRKKPRRPMITIVDDDGWIGVYTILFELAKEYNIPITSAMITSRAMQFPGDNRPQREQNYSYEQVMEMRDSGLVEFISHSHYHNRFTDMTEADIREDFELTRSFLRKYKLNHRTLAFPGGQYGERELGIATEYFDYGIGSGTVTDAGKRIVAPPVNNYRLGRFNADGTKPFDEIRNMMEETVSESGWLILTTHIGQIQGTDEAHIRRIITTALEKGLEFVKVSEGIEHHGNIAQFGGSKMNPDTAISSQGQITSNSLGRVVIDHSLSIDGDTPITYFKKDAITVSRISASRGGFPNADSGILKTHRLNSDLWSYQEFTHNRTGHRFIRNMNDDGEWTRWGGTSTIFRDRPEWMSASTPPSKFAIGLSVCAVEDSYEGFPDNNPGVLTTYRMVSPSANYNYQEYKLRDKLIKYIRHETAGDTWGNWQPMSSVYYLNRDTVSASTLASEFDDGITIVRIRGANASGFPDDSGGMLTTYTGDVNESGWTYQEYKKFNSFDKYIRFDRSVDGEWSAWKKFTLEDA